MVADLVQAAPPDSHYVFLSYGSDYLVSGRVHLNDWPAAQHLAVDGHGGYVPSATSSHQLGVGHVQALAAQTQAQLAALNRTNRTRCLLNAYSSRFPM